MTAKTGHSAFDVTAGIAEELAKLPEDEARIAFLRAGIAHAEGQLAAAELQYAQVSAKADEIETVWSYKVDEAHAIRINAAQVVDVLTQELEALER